MKLKDQLTMLSNFETNLNEDLKDMRLEDELARHEESDVRAEDHDNYAKRNALRLERRLTQVLEHSELYYKF